MPLFRLTAVYISYIIKMQEAPRKWENLVRKNYVIEKLHRAEVQLKERTGRDANFRIPRFYKRKST